MTGSPEGPCCTSQMPTSLYSVTHARMSSNCMMQQIHDTVMLSAYSHLLTTREE